MTCPIAKRQSATASTPAGATRPGWGSFAHTVLVDMRARLAASKDPRRIFTVTVEAASSAGLVSEKRVLDSTPLYDAVATMDTITLILVSHPRINRRRLISRVY
jgi:hypothetical protein